MIEQHKIEKSTLMAKSKSILRLQGTYQGITFVNSRAYGDHVRAARGTHKKADVNEAFKKESARLLNANVPAKVLKDAIDIYREELRGGSLWQRLVSMFRRQLKEKGSYDFGELPPFEVHEDYPFKRFLDPRTELQVDKQKRVLTLSLSYPFHPEFPRSSFIDGYRLGLIAIFPDVGKLKSCTDLVYSGIIPLKSKVLPVTLTLPIPARSKSFVLCLKIDGCMKDIVNDTPATKGMRVLGSGRV